jgi:hypothetical protein
MSEIGIYAKSVTNTTVNDPIQPSGCSVITNADDTATITWNNAPSGSSCPTATVRSGQSTAATNVTMKIRLDSSKGGTKMARQPKGKYCEDNRRNIIKTFASNGTTDNARAVGDCEAFCMTSTTCNFCSVDQQVPKKTLVWQAIPTCGTIRNWGGALVGDISAKNAAGSATITLSGPADVWFAVGLDATNMANSPYTLIVNSTGVSEMKLGTCGSEAEHCPGDYLSKSVTVTANSVVGGVRTVTMTRPFVGATSKHYTFSSTVGTVEFISAVGTSEVFAYHHAHDQAIISFTAPGTATCLCDAGATGKLCETNGTKCGSFVKNCIPRTPGLGNDGSTSGDLFAQHNPTCNSGQYSGGLRCCGHKRILLDADQEIRPELLQYHMK